MRPKNMPQALAALARLHDFIPKQQANLIRHFATSEEGQFFCDKILELDAQIAAMPKTGENDVDDPVVHLHYYFRGCDWWITERDSEPEQHQAFGFCCLNGDKWCAELGYVSLIEIGSIRGVELDLHWTPRPLSQVKKEGGF